MEILGIIGLILFAIVIGCGMYKNHLRTEARIEIIKEINRREKDERIINE